MYGSIYTLVSGMLTQEKKMNIIANNVANSTTISFKKDVYVSDSFQEYMMAAMGTGQNYTVNNQGLGVLNVMTSLEQGDLEETGKNTDVALKGSGFFTVMTPQGIRYTRNGYFSINPEGHLTTQEGYFVMGEKGRIKVSNDYFEINEQGGIKLGDEYIDALKLADFTDKRQLVKEREGYFIPVNGKVPDAVYEGEVKQGNLEASNVDNIKELTNIMVINRNYETNQRMIRMIDAIYAKAANEIGKV